MAPDDTVAAKLPRMSVPGMQTPPPQPPGLDPMEGLKNMARDAANNTRAQFAPQAPPPVAPLMGPDAGASFLPALQKIDAGMRGVHSAITAGAVDAIEKPSSNYTINGQTATDPDVNGMKRPPGVDLGGAAGRLMDRVGEGVFGADYQRPRTQTHAMDPFAYRAPAAAASPPGTATAPAAPITTPPAAVPAEPTTTPPGGDKFDKQVQLASLISAQNNSRAPVSNPYEGPAAGVAPPAGGVHGSIGVEGFQKQLANIQALRTPEPQTGGGAAADTETWQDKQNREKSEKWAQEDQMRVFKSINPNTAGGRAQLAAMGQIISSGQSAAASRHGADASAGASMHSAQLGYQGGRERDAANLQATGMQVSGQDRSSQRSTDASRYGHNMHANTAMQDAMLRAQTAMQGHQVQRDTNAATNASALERTRMMVEEGRHRTDQTALTEQNRQLAALYGFKPDMLDSRFGVNAAGQRIQFGLVQPKDKKAEK